MPQTSFCIKKSDRKALILDALALSSWTATDQLDCSVSFLRQSTDKTPLEVLSMSLKKGFFVFNLMNAPYRGEEPYFDVGCSTIGGNVDYFLWINLTIENGNKLIKKYNLKSQI